MIIKYIHSMNFMKYVHTLTKPIVIVQLHAIIILTMNELLNAWLHITNWSVDSETAGDRMKF